MLNLDMTKYTRATHHPLYGRWQVMRQRCQDPKSSDYPRYGGRGIKVCDRWNQPIKHYSKQQGGFWNFLEDMGEPIDMSYQIDRIDNEGDYTPKNCRWATRKQNQANRTFEVNRDPMTGKFTFGSHRKEAE